MPITVWPLGNCNNSWGSDYINGLGFFQIADLTINSELQIRLDQWITIANLVISIF